MKKLKCIKCGLRYKDREDPEEKGMVYRELCFNCNFVWKGIGMMIKSFPDSINREVVLNLDNIIIRKKMPYRDWK